MPDDLRAQIEPLLQAVTGMGLPLLRIAGVEADDVIGTLATRAAQAGEQVLISTGDKDMAQLVNERITLINTMNDSVLDRAGVKAKFDVYPEQIIDYLALVGDSSDNIPGVDKVGPKTAAKWLNAYGTLDALLAHAAEITGKVGENLRAGLANRCARRASSPRSAATSRWPSTRPAWCARPPTSPACANCTRDWRCARSCASSTAASPRRSRQRRRAAGAAPTAGRRAHRPAPTSIERQYTLIADWTQFLAWCERLARAPLFAFDTETTGLDYMQAQIVGVSFCVEPGRAAYVPLAHRYAGRARQLDRDRVLAALRPLLEDPAHAKVGAHMKFDMHVLANHGITLRGQRYDTMLESYVLNSTATRHDMDSMAARYLGIKTIHFEDVAGKGAKQISFDQVSVETAAEYAAEDADVTLRLHQHLWPQLEAVPALARLYEQIEQPLVPVLQRMERGGVLIDRAMLRQQSIELAARLKELGAEAQRVAGQEFNVESPRQLQQILFEKLQIPVLRKTPTGQPSTAEDVLEELAAEHALPRLILDYRALAKLRSTYTEKLPEQIDPTTGRVHTSLSPGGGGHRPAVLDRPEPAEHSDPQPRRTPHPPGVHRAAGPGAAVGRLFADRAAHHGAPVGRRGPAARVRRRPGHPPRHGRRGVRRRPRAGQLRPAPLRQGHQLRPDLRHVGLRAGAPARHRARRRGAVRRTLLRALPRRAPLHGRHARARQARRLRRDGVRPAPLPAGNQFAQPAAAAVRRAQRHQRADAGHGGGHHQARDARAWMPGASSRACRRACSCRCTTNWCSKSARISSTRPPRRCARSWPARPRCRCRSGSMSATG